MAATGLVVVGAALGLFWTHVHGPDNLTEPAARVLIALPCATGIVWTFIVRRPALPELAARLGDVAYVAYLSHALALDILARLTARLPLGDGGMRWYWSRRAWS